MRVFLTGGTGFIGQALLEALLRRGWSVTALVRRSEAPRARRLGELGARLAGGDVTDRESMRAAMDGTDLVRLFLPVGLAKLLFAPLEPLQRALGIPALLSREVVGAVATNWNYSSAKAQRELGWRHRSREEMWDRTLEAERQLLAKRGGQGLLQRITPLD